MSADRDSKIIGYFAMRSPQAVVCTGTACVIAGSEKSMRGFLEELHPGNNAQHIIRKTRFSEIMAGMRLGAPYSFDEESFALGSFEFLDFDAY